MSVTIPKGATFLGVPLVKVQNVIKACVAAIGKTCGASPSARTSISILAP